MSGAFAGAAAPLAAGGVLVGFAPAGSPPDGAAVVLADAGGATARAGLVGRAGATLTSLEDGAILVFGGVDASAGDPPEGELYRPHLGRFEALFARPDQRRYEHAAVLLDDGSVLILGGRGAGDAPLADAWIYRHDLIGPRDDVRAQVFNGPELASLIIPGDPALAEVRIAEGRLRLVASDDPTMPARVALAGPRYVDVNAVAFATADDGVGIALLFGLGSDEPLVASLVPSTFPAVVGLNDGVERCRASEALPAGALLPGAVPHEHRDGVVTITLDSEELLACDADVGRGLVGIAAVGSAPGAELSVVVFISQR
jgi:hypothetical protein